MEMPAKAVQTPGAFCDQVFAVIEAIHREGVAILLIEQNAARALAVATRAYVIDGGRVVSAGAPAELLDRPHIREAYLGEGP